MSERPLYAKYSNHDFTNQDLTSADFSDKPEDCIIWNSTFYQETTEAVAKNVFPSDLTGVLFARCNLDNVVIPAGCEYAPNCSIDVFDSTVGKEI